MFDALLTADPSLKLQGLDEALRRTDAPQRVEAAMPDLLREGDDTLLEALARGLGRFADEPAARRTLEILARRGGSVRVAALRALRGGHEPTPAPRGDRLAPGASLAGPPPTRSSPEVARPAAGTAESVRSPEPGLAAPDRPQVAAPTWDAPFELVLAEPTPARIAEAALALVDLGDTRPPGATRETLQALAGRLAMASFDQEGPIQAGLARLAKGLKALG